MLWRCSMVMPERRLGALLLLALWPVLAPGALAAEDVAGTYRHEGPIAATLVVEPADQGYLVRLEGGGSAGAGASAPADCVIEAGGALDGQVLRVTFGPVETDTFVYDASQAVSEGRMVEIVFDPGTAHVVQADTFGYCGLGAEFTGIYRKLAAAAAVTTVAETPAARFLLEMLEKVGRDVDRMRAVQATIRTEMAKQGVPDEVAVADFVRRPDPAYEQQRQRIATALGWQP